LPKKKDRSIFEGTCPTFQNTERTKGAVDEVGKLWGPTTKHRHSGDGLTRCVSVVSGPVVAALVFGTATGASGKGEMMRLDNQSDVSRAGEQMMGVRTIQVQGTVLLHTDSVVNAVSVHKSRGELSTH